MTTTYLKEYRPLAFTVDSVALKFELEPTATRVTNMMRLRKKQSNQPASLVLDGENLTLISIALNEAILTPLQYQLTESSLTIENVPDEFTLTIVTQIDPKNNLTLSGLYLSKSIFVTQCEAHGFRRMTYYIDRPDCLSTFTTTLVADKAQYPILLANGNCVERGEGPKPNQHWATWSDPFKKPCYLFALVAGQLELLEDTYTTTLSKRKITLQIYSEPGKSQYCNHAMESLKKSMRWDEERFGREYDLDIFMIVAVGDFNAGAMENKGLNIFNDQYILADPKTATDTDFFNIESVVAHEYFHNWTGNRVTCRDWFQLSLKEGLTVFRDQEFSRDMNSREVKRLEDVNVMRTVQFAEDQSAMIHPVRPESYQEVNNFYTATVYNKGAEVIRMMETVLGVEGFRKGMDLYFSRHDGQAVTIEDFVKAMEDANQQNLSQFRLWYSQAGTPEVTVTEQYDATTKTLALSFTQSLTTRGNATPPLPMFIPIRFSLYTSHGKAQTAIFQGEQGGAAKQSWVLPFTEKAQTFYFTEVQEHPVCSLLEEFSAPIKLTQQQSPAIQQTLLKHSKDGFVRTESALALAIALIKLKVSAKTNSETVQAEQIELLQEGLQASFLNLLQSTKHQDPALLAHLLTLPNERYLADFFNPIPVQLIHQSLQEVKINLANVLSTSLREVYDTLSMPKYEFSQQATAKRMLKNVCLHYLVTLNKDEYWQLAKAQMLQADNMTDEFSALAALSYRDNAFRSEMLKHFYDRWCTYDLVINKWFSVQAQSDLQSTLALVQALKQNPSYEMSNPNKVRALVGVFANNNPSHFHAIDGSGYRWVAEEVLALDALNPMVAARLVAVFGTLKRYPMELQALMQRELQRLSSAKLSKNVREIVEKTLQTAGA